MRNEGGGFAANIYGAMPEGLLIAGFPRIASLPLEGKVPRRGGQGTSGMKDRNEKLEMRNAKWWCGAEKRSAAEF